MRRLIAVVPAAVTVGAVLRFAGLAWPIANTAWSIIAPRPVTEADPI